MRQTVYVASKFERYREVRKIYELLRHAGHDITHDWTRTNEFDANGEFLPDMITDRAQRVHYAMKDREGVRSADLTIMWDHPKLLGGLLEAGMALGIGKQIYLAEPLLIHQSIFWDLPEVTMFPTISEALAALDVEYHEQLPALSHTHGVDPWLGV